MGRMIGDLERALGYLPLQAWIMSSAFEMARTGVLTRRVTQCADEPVCLCVSLKKGSRIDPVIRDSHVFAVSLMPNLDKLLVKKFDQTESTDEDPFDSFKVVKLKTGSPVLAGAVAAFDCEVISHVDLEADCELYVGRIVEAVVVEGGAGK